MTHTPLDTKAMIETIDTIEVHLARLRRIVETPQAAENLDPKDPANKGSDGKLTDQGVRTCYGLFAAGKTRYAVAAAMGISHKAATHRFSVWQRQNKSAAH